MKKMDRSAGERNIASLLENMKPQLFEEAYVFVCVFSWEEVPFEKCWAMCREDEGISCVVEEKIAVEKGWKCSVPMKRISLSVHSSLEAVGLTAAIANRLAEEEISCNVIAGYYHDHIFVPIERAEHALAILKALSINGK